MLQEGQPFPEFSLQDQNGTVITKSDLKGQEAIIYFYPKDDTPGCTAEACEFQSSAQELKKIGSGGVRVVGVSPDGVKSHKKFADKFNLEFTLLADVDHTLAEAAGVWVEKSMYGKKYMGTARTTFLIDGEGNISNIIEKVDTKNSSQQVLDLIQ